MDDLNNCEAWKSTDSGVSWSFVLSQPLGINPNGWEGADVYWDYKANAPALRGTTVVSLDSNHLFNTQGDWAAYRSMDGGISWKSCGSSVAGFSAYADTINKLYYSSQETNDILTSADSGKTWNSLPKMPPVAWMDGIEGCGEKIFVRTGVGLYGSIDRGTTWDSIGGPKTRFQEAKRFNIIGCNCSTVIAPDDTGALWIANPEDATPPPSLHSTFSTNAFECDTSKILVKIDSSFLPGRFRLTITNDSDGNFSIVGPDTVLGNSAGSSILVNFLSHDLRTHHATITIVSLDYGQCMSESHAITGIASLAAPVIPGTYVRVGCDTAKGAIAILNSNCDSIRLTSASNPSSDFSLLPFDSVVRATGSIPLSFLPFLKTGLQKYPVHLTGHFEPSGIPFDTVISVTAQYGHLYSNIVVPALTFDFGTLPNCAFSADTLFTFWNDGCDTLRVPLSQTHGKEWSITPASDTLTLYPGQLDTIRVHFATLIPGSFTQNLTYSYSGPHSGTLPIHLSVTVGPAHPAVSLSDTAFDLGNRSFCANDTIVSVWVHNAGCDSVLCSSLRMTGSNAFTILNSRDTALAPGDSIQRRIAVHPRQKGPTHGEFIIHLSRTDGSMSHDTLIPLSVNVVRGTALLACKTSALDLGTTPICQERDTFVVIQNTGCDTVCDSSVALSAATFQLAKPWSARCLAPGERDTVWLSTAMDTNGHHGQNVATLTIASNADTALPPIMLAREIQYPVAWQLTLSAPDSAYPGQPVTYKLLQHGTLPADDTAIDFVLHYDDDLLQFLSADEPFARGAGFQPALHGMPMHIAPVPADSVLATLHFTTFLAPNQHTTISVDGINFSSSLARPSDCIALAQVDTGGFSIRTLCGATELSKELNGLPLTLDAVVPNPSHNEVTLYYSLTGSESIPANIVLEDALGRTRLVQQVQLAAGMQQSIPLDLSGVASGVYNVRLGPGIAKRIVKE